MKTKYFIASVLWLCIATSGTSCKKDPSGIQDQDNKEVSKGDDIRVIDGKVKFFIEASDNSPRSVMGREFNPENVVVNSVEYEVLTDDKGNRFINVNESKVSTYMAVLKDDGSERFHSKSLFTDVMLPYSQFQDNGRWDGYPMYAEYSAETGNILTFRDGFSLLDLTLSGSAGIVSVKVEDKDGMSLAGKMNYSPSKRQLTPSKGVPFVVLNTTGDGQGRQLTGSGTHFLVAFCPGRSLKTLTVTVCDSEHRMMKFDVPVDDTAADKVIRVSKEYSPDADLLFYEGFDRFVWGGDYVAGEASVAFAPDADLMGIDGRQALSGNEDAFTLTGFDNPGSGFFQSNDWSDVSGKTVSSSHKMSEGYLKSRGLWDYELGFRSLEYQGYVGIGTATEARGITQTCFFRNITGLSDVTVSFDIAVMAGFNDDILLKIVNAGYVNKVSFDGKVLNMSKTDKYHTAAENLVVLRNEMLSVASQASDAKKWHHVELSVENATDATQLFAAGNSVESGRHGVFIDNITVRRIAEPAKGTLRVLYWNIQCGMWADQENSYKNFTDWVKKYNPDICVFCESTTIYNASGGQASTKYLPSGWPDLAVKWGHPYTALGGWRDNHPQVITSRYPIETLEKITSGDISGKPVSHGAGLHKVTVGGRPINIITLHTWPQDYAYGVSSADRPADIANRGGDYYREYEMECIVSRTINNTKYSGARDWLMIGDFNSWSRIDNFRYEYPEDDPIFRCQDVVREKTSLVDVIGKRYEGEFFSTIVSNFRIDFIYASPSLYANVKNATVLTDFWTRPVPSRTAGGFYCPSDHRPILVDFNL